MDASVIPQAKGADARAEALVASYERAGYVTAMRAANAGAYAPW